MKNKTKEFTKKAFQQYGKAGSDKRWAKRLLLIEELQNYGGEQVSYKNWSTKQLKTLLKVWKGIKQ